MRSVLRSSRQIRSILVLSILLLGAVALLWGIRGSVWTTVDHRVLDRFWQAASNRDPGPPASHPIVYLTITDSSYAKLGNQSLNRTFLAEANELLATFAPRAVAYDIIFARPGDPADDARFAASLKRLGNVYLPIGLDHGNAARPFSAASGEARARLGDAFSGRPAESGPAKPFYASRALMQMDAFARAAFGAGHIGVRADEDGVFRRQTLVLKIDEAYLPTLALSMFLDYVRVPLSAVRLEWGRRLVIKAVAGSRLTRDMVVPMDARGRTVIAFRRPWGRDFQNVEIHRFLEYGRDPDLRGNLAELFENQFVFIGDVSTGSADLAPTPLEPDAPLIVLHSTLLDAFLAGRFYQEWSSGRALALIGIAGLLLTLAALFKSLRIFYGVGAAVLIFSALFAWNRFLHFQLLPAAAVSASLLFVFTGLAAGLQVVLSRERAFIKNAFSLYVPTAVVGQLLAKPEMLRLGGEEREMTVLFSDLENFTAISETLAPADLVSLLNEYLTAMTGLVLAEGGIIDKYLGDAVMAEFGAPLPLADHADRAVSAALRMLCELEKLRRQWRSRGVPALRCRVGINTGRVIVGNMGSRQVFDYTVVGDAVNLASRLEGANKNYGTRLMISGATFEALTPGKYRTRILDLIRVKGKTTPVTVYEVYGRTRDAADPDRESFCRLYQEGFKAFTTRDFSEARRCFTACLTLKPADLSAVAMLARLEGLDSSNLPSDWDGSMSLATK